MSTSTEATTTGATTATETPAPSATDSPSRAADASIQTTANGQGEEQSAATAQPDWRDSLKSVDREELLKHVLDSTDNDTLLKTPKLSGMLGDLAERRAKAKEAEIEKRISERQERERLKQLRDSDPYAYAQEERKREDAAAAEERAQAEQGRQVVALAGELNTAIAEFARTSLAKEVNEKLAGKRYDGTLAQGLANYVKDVVTESVAAREAELRTKWEKEALPALRKEALAKLNGGEDSDPDTSSGTAPAGALTQAEWARNFSNRAWRKANADRINEAVSSGRINAV